MEYCQECFATEYISFFNDKQLCEKCLIFYDYEHEADYLEDEDDNGEDDD